MARAQTEPTDGFLDREFASFRQARLKAKKSREEQALEPRRSKPPAETSSSSSIEAVLEGLEPEAPLEIEEHATRADLRPDDLPKVNKVPALSPLAMPEGQPSADEQPRADAPAESCSDPEFEKFRAARATGRHSTRPESSDKNPRPVQAERPPSSDKNPRPVKAERPPSNDKNPRPATRAERPSSDRNPRPGAAERTSPAQEGSCSDPGFEKFRAARRPESARHRKPEPVRPAEASDARPDTPTGSGAGRVEDTCSDPEFEKFRAARQGRPDSARHRKPEAEVAEDANPTPTPVQAPVEAGPSPEPAAATASAEATASEDEGLFFGTSVHERAKVRARVLDSRSELEPIEPAADSAPAAEPTPSGGERRRAPPPPLPERP